MITIRKLASLKTSTALRKAAVLLQGFEYDLIAGKDIDTRYLEELICTIILPADPQLGRQAQASLSSLKKTEWSGEKRAFHEHGEPGEAPFVARPEALRRICNDLRHLLYGYLDTRPADWDLIAPAGAPSQTGSERLVLPLVVFLEDLRSPFNVGSILRSAESFCVQQVVLTPACPRPDSPRASRSSMGSDTLVPWTTGGLERLEGERVFALETGGTPVDQFQFPAGGAVIVGNEELGVSPAGRRRAEESEGIVSIPLYGVKGSLSVTAAFAILMYCWCTQLICGKPEPTAK